MKKRKYILTAFALLLLISCKKESINNPSNNNLIIKNSGCLLLTANEGLLLQTELSYDANDRIATCLKMSFSDESIFYKFEYAIGFCYVKLNYINGMEPNYYYDTIKLNANGFFDEYYNKSKNITVKAFYNDTTQLLESLNEYTGRATLTPKFHTEYVYDSKNRMIEKNVYLSTSRITKVRVTTVEYNNMPNNIGIIAGNPLDGFYNNDIVSRLISYHVNLSEQFFLSNNYRTDGLPTKESVQTYINGSPFGSPEIKQYNYFTNSANQVDSILPIIEGREFDGLKLEFRCK